MGRHFVYILSSQKRGTLYIGVTNNLSRRIYEHQQNLIPGFTSKYSVYLLVHVEEYDLMLNAIAREKKLKKWNRDWKINLIERQNPEWNNLSSYLLDVSE